MYHGTIAFLGEYRPRYFSADTLDMLRSEMISAAIDPQIRAWVEHCCKSIAHNFSACAIEYGARCVSVQRGGDNGQWLADICADMPESPAISYR